MENGIRKMWLTMSEPRLRNHLVDKLHLPSPIVERTIRQVAEIKAERRKVKIKAGQSRPLWDEFFEAPRHESGILRVLKAQMKKQGAEASPRWLAVSAYNDVIQAVIDKLKREAKARNATPSKLAAMLHAEGFSLPRNDGSHWTDYVKNSDLTRIRDMFNKLTPPTRGRHKTPFDRMLPPKTYKKRKAIVSDRLESDLASAERELEVTRDPDRIEQLSDQIDKMYRAQFLLLNHKRNTPLPLTWHGLVD
jgi:hypothetical protein